MPRRYRPRSTPKENLHIVIQAIPWRLLLLIPVLLVAAIPAYVYGAHVGTRVLPSMTNFFYNLSAPPPTPSPTPLPALPTILPQPGSVLYTVQNGDSCVGILSSQMQMSDAGQISVMSNRTRSKHLTLLWIRIAMHCSLGWYCHYRHIIPS